MGAPGTPVYRMLCAGWGCELTCVGLGQLWHQWEQHCNLSGIPDAPVLMYLMKHHSHHGEGTCGETGEERWRGQEGATSGEMSGNDLCEGLSPCQSRDYWGTVAVDNPRWGRNTPKGLRTSLKVLQASGITCRKNNGRWTWGNGNEGGFLSICLNDYVFLTIWIINKRIVLIVSKLN